MIPVGNTEEAGPHPPAGPVLVEMGAVQLHINDRSEPSYQVTEETVRHFPIEERSLRGQVGTTSRS